MLRCKSKLCILRLKFGGNAPAICTFTPVKVPPKWDLKLLVKRPVFCSLHCFYISMPIAKYVCQQSEKAQQEPVPRVSLANQTGENMAASIRIRQRHLSEMKGRKHSRMTVELTRLYFHYLSSTSFKLKWLETTFCPYKDRRCINLSVSLLWVFCHCLVPSSHVSSSDRPYVLQCCFVRVGRREDLCEEPALIMHEFQLPGEHTTRLAEMERGTEHRQTKQDSCWFKDCPNF